MASSDISTEHTLSSLIPLVELCQLHDLPLTQEKLKQFEHYLELLLRFNRSMNLIGPMDAHDVVEELLCDSIMPTTQAPPTGTILDIGTGAGLPGIPLKILYPESAITLVEPRKKRASFLRIVVSKLSLDNAEILNARLEDTENLGHDYVISKAFQPPQTWIETALGVLSPTGKIACMTRASVQPELDAHAASLGLQQSHAIPGYTTTRDGVDDRTTYIYTRTP